MSITKKGFPPLLALFQRTRLRLKLADHSEDPDAVLDGINAHYKTTIGPKSLTD